MLVIEEGTPNTRPKLPPVYVQGLRKLFYAGEAE